MKPYYQDEAVTIYHGDARDFVDLFPADAALVTDPPYGLGDKLHRPGPGKWSKLYGSGAPEWDSVALPWLPDLVARFTTAIVWGGNYYPFPPARGWLIWDKIVREFSSGHAELAWTTLDQPVRAYNYAHAQLASEGKFHPTQKPLPLMRWCLEFLPPQLTIVDPFMGSGTTLRAAKDVGRKAIGVELDESYCERAVRRMGQGSLGLLA